MYITFYGAAGGVTGSCSLVEANNKKILVDCGMYQGSDFNEGKNSDPFAFNPKELESVIVTHAHLDHTGRLPILIKNGFEGKFYATPATIELTELILEDALSIMTYNNHKFSSPILYNQSDIAGVMQQFKPVDYYEEFSLSEDIKFKFYEAGHIFGSVFAEINAEGKRVVFSGDVGNINVPILRDTDTLPNDIDVLVCESTYGDRVHESATARQALIERLVSEAIDRGGVLMIPSFSLERTQELLYDLNDLIDRKGKLSSAPIFLDSPLAIGATRVYRHFSRYYDDEATKFFKEGDDLFNFSGLTLTETKEESKRINQVPNPKIIIAGAGMMNGGRILHHAIRYLSDERNTLLIIGYQAYNTLGRKILNGESPVNVMGEQIPVHCKVEAIGALSAHADQAKLLSWITGGKTLPKKVCLNHGEPHASEALAKLLKENFNLGSTAVSEGFRMEV